MYVPSNIVYLKYVLLIRMFILVLESFTLHVFVFSTYVQAGLVAHIEFRSGRGFLCFSLEGVNIVALSIKSRVRSLKTTLSASMLTILNDECISGLCS